MCYSPLKVTNNSRDFSTYYDRVYNSVPCGHCGECLTRKQNDWIARSYYEWLNCKEKGGYALFVTLTYSNENLPVIALNDSSFPCFSKKDVQLFLDNLRKRISRTLLPGTKLKYLFTSEFGGKTFRPHYHTVLYFYDNLPLHKVRNIIKELWHYGFIKFGDNYGVVSGLNGIKYVAKYITKDYDFYNNQHYPLLDQLNDDIKKEVFPFHLVSNGFGSCICDKFSVDQLMDGKLPLPDKSCYKMVRVPLYIDRKLFYFVDEYKSYRLNENGVKMKLCRQKDYNLYLRNYINGLNESLDTWLCSDSLKTLQTFYNSNITANEVINKFTNFFQSYTVDEFIDYLSNRRDFSYLDDTNIVPNSLKDSQTTYYDRLNRFLQPSFSPSPYSDFKSDLNIQKHVKTYLYNDTERDLEDFAQLFDLVRFVYGKYRNQYYYNKQLQHSKSKLYKND